jgi:Spy/CpxP family protein refolding chaperone
VSLTRFISGVALVSALAVPALALAQQAPPPGAPAPAASAAPHHHGHRHHSAYMRALRSLNLSDAQKQQIKAAFQQSRQANQNADPATHKANSEKLHAQIDGILTPAQRTQLQTTLKQERNQQKRPGMGVSPAPSPIP